jgi:hypothetical protein
MGSSILTTDFRARKTPRDIPASHKKDSRRTGWNPCARTIYDGQLPFSRENLPLS